MRKITFLIGILALLTLSPTQDAPAAYTVLNGGKEQVQLIVSTWMEGTGDIPAGFRTTGYYTINSGDFFIIRRDSSDYYIRMHNWIGDLIIPSDYKTRGSYVFRVEPNNRFTVVEDASGKLLYGSDGIENLTLTSGFYKYPNETTFIIEGDNLQNAKLKKVSSELKEKERDLAEIRQQLLSLNSPLTQVRSAGYTVLNGSGYDVWLIVSTWMESTGDIPAGYRTMGHYKIQPGYFYDINWGISDYYIRMHNWIVDPIIPNNHETRDSYVFWVEPKNGFTVAEREKGRKILYSSVGKENLTRTGGFYKYSNTGTFKIQGDHLELAEKELKLAEINYELGVRKFELAMHRGQFDGIGDQEVHALLILLGNDKKIRASVEQNESLMKNLLRQVSQHANVHLTVMISEEEITGKVETMKLSAGSTNDIKSRAQGLIKGYQVSNWLNSLDVNRHDTILIYYNGHGNMQGFSNKHILNFDQQTNDVVLRATLRKQLERKPARLKMLITDTCSNHAGTPELVAKSVTFASIHQRSTVYTKNLFLQHKGVLDITAAESGHYAWGSTDIGGYFTVGLLQSFTAESDMDRDRFLTWREVFEAAQQRTDGFFKQTNFQSTDKIMMGRIGQKTQKPAGYSFPLRVK
jgi:hypothetical protein